MQNPLNLFVQNPGLPWHSGEFVYLLEPDIPNKTWKFTINFDSVAVEPSRGDIYKYVTKKPFTSDDVYEIRTEALKVENDEVDLNKIKVVPNPYIVYNVTEQAASSPDRFTHNLRFTHLPKECTIKIYTVSGQLVKTLHHSSSSIGEESWNLLSDESLMVSYGVYVYTVQTPDGKHKIGKFAIVW